jgi:hypothetical protein
MRIDDAEQISLFGITTRLNVWTSIFVFVAALAVFIVLGRRKDGNADSVYLPGREPAAAVARKSDAGKSDAGKSDAGKSDAGKPDAGEANAGKSVAGEPDGGKPAGAETASPALVPATLKDSGSAPNVTANTVRDTDPVVSDSESRDNLPDNQNGSGLASAQAEAVPASTGGTPTAAESRNTGKPGGTDTGAAPEAGSSR